MILVLALPACSGCEDERPPPVSSRDRDQDGGSEEDNYVPPEAGPLPIKVPDAAAIFPGEPPEELAGESCAAHTNKIYELASGMTSALPAQLAVDIKRARFGLTFVTTEDATCSTGVGFTELYGAPGVAEGQMRMAYDDCTLVEHAAIVRARRGWLVAIADNRMEARELWVHEISPEGRLRGQPHRITTNMAGEPAVALVSIDDERSMIAWTEVALDGSGSALKVQVLAADGEPIEDPVVLEPTGERFFDGFSMVRLGEHFVGLAYRQQHDDGSRALVFDVLNKETGERDREPWVLTTEPGENGSVDLAADHVGAGVAYTIAQGTSRQVWFQALTLNGRAAPVQSGGLVGGPSEPNRIVGIPQLAVDVSVARLATGFAVVYRALPSVGVAQPQIRAHFLDRTGRIVGDSGIALASALGGKTAIKAAYDGRVVISWTDLEEDGSSTVRALMMPCGS